MNCTRLVINQFIKKANIITGIKRSHILTTTVTNNYLKKNYNKKFIMTQEKPKIIFVLGAPGAGKGTQCEKIVSEFGFKHLSAGDLLREERARDGSEFGALIEDYITNGKIVPVEITCSLLENAMTKTNKETGNNKFLIDGFPRNEDNLQGWEKQMSEKIDFVFVLFFDCSEDKCVDRCLKRGQAGSGRTDDNLESLKKRFNTYLNDTMPIISHYRGMGKVRQIDANCCPDNVFKDVKVALDEGIKDKLF